MDKETIQNVLEGGLATQCLDDITVRLVAPRGSMLH